MTGRTKSYQSESSCWLTLSTAATPVLDQKADFTAFTSDGFTLNHITVATASPVFVGLIVRGVQLDVAGFISNSGTGAQVFTTGFTPIGGLFIGAPSATTTLDAVVAEAHSAIGFFDGTAEESIWTSADDVINTDTNNRTATDKVVQACTNPSTVACEADFTSFDAAGFTINWSTAAARRFGYLAMGPQQLVEAGVVGTHPPPLRIFRQVNK